MVGSALRPELDRHYVVRGLDIARSPLAEYTIDLRSARRAERAFVGADLVLDLAADASPSATWRDIRENNIAVALNTLEAAHRAGVKRVVLASSNRVTAMAEHKEPYAAVLAGRYEGLDPDALHRIGTDEPVCPDSPYGVGKVMAEAAARYYADAHDLSVLCLRLGSVNRADRPSNARHFATFLSHGDLVRLIRCCVAAPEALRFGVYYGVSANTWRIWDIGSAAHELGYRPEDDAERWRESR